MRIITGKAKGCKLKTPKGMSTRPTADRIKESLFNILNADIAGTHVLDIFAGTGNLGLEALSRGAIDAVFIDQSVDSVNIIKQNAEHTKLTEATEIIKCDVFTAMKKLQRLGKKFDIVFCDPPYNKNLCQKALLLFDEMDLLTSEALVIMEHAAEDSLELNLQNIVLFRNQRYGATTQISIFIRKTDFLTDC
ncbi:16S rRNA (guanine(966)-N(2))-methyltransferase RsmD [Propionispira arboris]|uniref:16S rRNA (Guanine(966)-N(2))-methyltransferase RsmD n=1 Tax=Propionispira arboris TaxID=84035 RepID=A0A1H6VSH2_9FIRM|nr:16S rRNA (guanine(966)-N(2))-methyltransferase RsmD [Propionispira arboris]SEJ07599.1 16S rRNA (guanine(966)-N(2))-methyltransferase RsmD [Propionispira arboris]